MLKNTENSEATKITDVAAQLSLVRLLKEPLLHFILAAAAIYLLFGLFGESESEEAADANTIVITQGEVDWLTATWQSRWNRLPTEAELKGLIDQYLRETVLYREALSMGLDKDDTIIRRRLAQKLEFLAQDLIQPEPPTDDELKKYFEENIDNYQAPDLITFTHVFLDPDKRDATTLEDAKALKKKLIEENQDPVEIKDLGDPFMLQRYYPERDESELAKLFGGEFARSLMELETGQWQGPVLSGYGVHIVYVHDRRTFPPPTFEQVAQQVQEDRMSEKRAEMNEEYIDSLLNRYTVVIEGQEDSSDGPLEASE